jgi:hypothetical protein
MKFNGEVIILAVVFVILAVGAGMWIEHARYDRMIASAIPDTVWRNADTLRLTELSLVIRDLRADLVSMKSHIRVTAEQARSARAFYDSLARAFEERPGTATPPVAAFRASRDTSVLGIREGKPPVRIPVRLHVSGEYEYYPANIVRSLEMSVDSIRVPVEEREIQRIIVEKEFAWEYVAIAGTAGLAIGLLIGQ